MKGRRSYLKGLGSIATVGVLGAGATTTAAAGSDEIVKGAASSGNRFGLPVRADGEMTVEIEREGGDFVRKRTFRSQDLEEHHGDPVFKFDWETVSPSKVPDEAIKTGSATYQYEDTRVIGSPTEQARAEAYILQQSPVSTETAFNYPLYAYEKKSNARDRLTDRGSPINLAWTEGPATKIRNWMQHYGWEQPYQMADEYTVDYYVNYSGMIKTDAHVMDTEFAPTMGAPSPSQDHIRLHEIGNGLGFRVVGQAHHDPLDHGKVDSSVNWHMDDARDRAVDLWTNNSDANVNCLDVGTERGSHDGEIKKIFNSGFSIPEDDGDDWPFIIL